MTLSSTQSIIIIKPVHHVEWPVQNVLAFTTTRHHPSAHLKNNHCSLSLPYKHFNLALHVGDDTKTVLTNRKILQNILPKHIKVQWLEQIHGADVLLVNEFEEQNFIADAVITRNKNIALAIMTADCLPILLAAKDGSEVAAIHGGWKPLAKNIIANTLDKMQTPNENIIAWLGPCIGKQVFEVGEEVKLAFVSQLEKLSSAFSSRASDTVSAKTNLPLETFSAKYLADLALIAQLQLSALGIKEFHHLDHCTYTDESQYFSYRREKMTGRMAAIICRL